MKTHLTKVFNKKYLILFVLCCMLIYSLLSSTSQAAEININEVRFKAQETNGYAWIANKNGFSCVSYDGNIISQVCSITPMTPIYHGFSIAYTPEGLSLVDIYGNIIFSEASIDASILTWSESNHPLKDGIVPVARMTETYRGTTYELGMLNTAGEWLSPLTSTHPILECGFEYDPQKSLWEQFNYAGNGIFLFKLGWNAYQKNGLSDGIYDVYNNSASAYDSHGRNAIPELGLHFKNGQAILMVGYPKPTSKLEALSRGGTIQTLAQFPSKTVDYEIDSSPAINGDYFFTLRSNGWNTLCILWNRNGDQIKNFDGLTIWPYGTFVNARVPAIIQNDRGTLYLTHIDTSGKFCFEPVEIDQTSYQIPHMAGPTQYNDSIVCFDGRFTILKGKENYYIYDENGAVVNTFPLRCYYGDYTIVGQNNNVFCIQLQPGLYDYITGDQIPAYQ